LGYPPESEFLCADVAGHSIIFFPLTSPMKIELTEGLETSAHKIRMPENHPKERIQHSEHGESLKSRIWKLLVLVWSLRSDLDSNYLSANWA